MFNSKLSKGWLSSPKANFVQQFLFVHVKQRGIKKTTFPISTRVSLPQVFSLMKMKIADVSFFKSDLLESKRSSCVVVSICYLISLI